MIRAGIRDWVFDLDNTLYPASSTMYDEIGKRMTAYVMRVTGLDAVEAERLQDRYHLEYGATVVGLARLTMSTRITFWPRCTRSMRTWSNPTRYWSDCSRVCRGGRSYSPTVAAGTPSACCRA